MRSFLRNLSVAVFMFFAWPFCLFKIYGNKRFKLSGKTIIISNHYSTFDAFLIYLLFRKSKIRFITITDVKKHCLPRTITWLFDCLYIDYGTVNLNFFKECISILNGGGVICIFPEGVVNPSKQGFFDFKQSFVYFARKTGAKILPLYVYPEFQLFKKSKIYIEKAYAPNEYKEYKSLYDAATFFQCKIIDYKERIKNGGN